MNYSISRRTREIGIRMSLGASRGDVLKMVLRLAMLQALAGTAVGIIGSLLLARLMTKMLYGIQPTDPLTFGFVIVVLGLAALFATLLPARKALRIEPLLALRAE
jgi:ABC-type antimicrobial peptide transport system permease subunit